MISRRGESGEVARYPLAFAPEESIQLGSDYGATMGMSPDGKALAYVGVGPTKVKQVFVRAVSDLRARAIAGTDGATQAFYSPDGKWIGFVANQKLQKVPVDGGTATVIADIGSSVRGVSWGSNDQIVIAATRLFVVPSGGGVRRPIVRVDSATVGGSQAWPFALPDGNTVLYTIWHGSLASARIGVANIEGGKTTELDLPGTAPLGVIEGRLIYVGPAGTLMAVPFDVRRARLAGAPTAMSDQVLVAPNGGVNASLSQGGSLVYQAGPSAQQLVLASGAAEPRVLISDPRLYSTPRFSPDGKRVAVTSASGASQDIWICDIAARAFTKLTTEGNNDRPEWSPDGKRVIYRSSRAGKLFTIWWQTADGGTPAEPLVRASAIDVAEAVLSRDGRTVVYRTGSAGTADLWYRRVEGDTTPKPIATTKFTETAVRISPDGQWVAYVSDESGQLQVYVVPFPGPGVRYQVTIDGGSSPVWSPDGRHLLYVYAGKVMAATRSPGPAFAVASRELRQDGEWSIAGGGHAGFDVSPDGKDLLLVRSVGGNVQTIVALNWRAEVRARAAMK